MKKLSGIKIGRMVVWFAFLFFITENFIFGWNKKPCSIAELYCDRIVTVSFLCGIGIVFWSCVNVLEEIQNKIKCT
jgi:hypothetical protein